MSNELLLDEIKKLQQQITLLESKVDSHQKSLSDHIGFINSVYDTIKRPLYYITDKINYFVVKEGAEAKPEAKGLIRDLSV